MNNINVEEYIDLVALIQDKIDKGLLKKQPSGLYKMSKKFPDCEKTVYAGGFDAKDLAAKMLEKKKERLVEIDEEKHVYFYKISQEWFDIRIKGMGLAKKNVSNYKTLLNNHILPYFKDRDMRTIKNNEVQMFLNLKGKAYSTSTVKKLKDIIIAIFEYAEDNEYIEHNTVRRLLLPKCKSFKDNSKDPVTTDEMILALKATTNSPMMQLALVMLYVYGLRTCELVNLEWQFVNFKENYFRVEKSKYTDAINVKNVEVTKRYLPLSPIVKTLMMRVKEEQNNMIRKPKGDFIFIKKNIKKQKKIMPLETTGMDNYFKTLTSREMEIANGAEVFNNQIVSYTGVRQFTPYAFRRGVVTRLNAMNYNDAITQMFVGHRPKEVKDRYYSKMNFDRDLRISYQRYMDETEKTLHNCFEMAGLKI